MADLLVISDAASKSIKEDLYPTLQENHWRTGRHPVLQMFGWEDKAVDQQTGAVNRPRVKPVTSTKAGYQIEVLHEHSLFGGGYCVEEDTSLDYGKRAEDRSTATIRFYEGAFKLSRQAIAASRDNEFAVVEQISRHSKNAMRQAQKDFGRMSTYLGSGVLAYVNVGGGVSASTVITVDNGGTSEGTPTRYLRPTKKVWIGTSGAITGGTADEKEVSSITSGTVVVMTSAGTYADDDIIVSKNVYATSAYREFESMANLINNTGTIQGVNKAANYWFASDVNGSIGALTISDIDSMVVDIRDYSADPSKVFLMANKTNWRRYSDLLTANKRMITTKKDYDGMLVGGASNLSYYAPDGDYPVFLCNDVPDGYMYAVDAEGYFFAEMHPLTFLEDAVNMMGASGQRVTGTTNYEFPFVHYGQIVQTNARSSGVLTGITS